MKRENIFTIARLILRLAEAFLSRRAPQERPTTRADKVVGRVAPLADKVLDRVAPETPRAAPPSPRARRSRRVFALARAVFMGALFAGGAAYLVLRQRRRAAARYHLLEAPFPEELLSVLAAPAGGGPLEYAEDRLKDPRTGSTYPVIDGIPDFCTALEPAGYGLGPTRGPAAEALMELLRPAVIWLLGGNPAGNTALAGAVAAAASDGWALSTPIGLEMQEIEMARANPQARILCIDDSWEAVLESRRRALAAGLSNIYWARGNPTLLPLQNHAVDAAWTANGFHRFPEPELAMTQIARAAKPGALVAGVSLVSGGPRRLDALAAWLVRPLPGRRNSLEHFSLLAAAGLRELDATRDGAFVRFTGLRD